MSNLWQSIKSFFKNLFGPKAAAPSVVTGAPAAPVAAAVAAAPAPAPAPVVAPPAPVEPAASVEPASYAKIRAEVARCKALGVADKFIVYQLKTMTLQRDLTPDEVQITIAAGVSASVFAVDNSAPVVNTVDYWTQDADGSFRIDVAKASGNWKRVTGPATLKLGVPADFKGKVWACGNLCPGTVYPVTSTVNGGDARVQDTDAEATHAKLCFGVPPGPGELAATAGQDVSLSISQSASSQYLGIFYVYPAQ